MKTDDADMRNLIEHAHNVGDAARREQKRVASGDDHLPDLRPLPDVVEGALERGLIQHPPLFAHNLASEAKTAVDRTQEGRLQQHPVGIAMDDARQWRPAL